MDDSEEGDLVALSSLTMDFDHKWEAGLRTNVYDMDRMNMFEKQSGYGIAMTASLEKKGKYDGW